MDAFEEGYKKLNLEQKSAVDAMEGVVMVIAGPGTGKTEILTMRIANIMRTGVPPENILALTFTESGAITMRGRLALLVGHAAYRVTISTFHGFANGIIRDYPDYFPDIIGASSITEIDQVRILRDILDKGRFKELRPFGDRYYYLTKALRAIDELKRQGVSPEAFDAIIQREKAVFDAIDDLVWDKGAHTGKMKGKYAERLKHIERNAELGDMYVAYQLALRKNRQYDYSDMIMEVAAALKDHNELLQILQGRFRYILIDEHQDTNDAQNAIVEMLAGANDVPNLFVVGDEKQAIYRFQGASLENFLYFRSKFPAAKLVPLVSNYRSTQSILDAADAVSPRENAKLLARAEWPDVPVRVVALSSPDVEDYFIAKTIKGYLEQGISPEEIAVLYRDNRDVFPLVRMLEKQGVPFNIESDQDILDDEDIQKIVKILKVLENFGYDDRLFEAMHVDFLGIAPLDIYAISVYAKHNGKRMYDVLRSPSLLDAAGVVAKEECLALYANLSNWERYARNRSAVDAFEAIVRESGFLASLLAHPSATEKMLKLHAFFDLLKSLIERDRRYTLIKFFEYLDLVAEHNISLVAKGAIRLPGRIRLMTAHRSKGLQFEHVFIMNAVAGKWGFRARREHIKLPKTIYRSAPHESEEADNALSQDDADERNIFYVALTRAKKEVIVTYSAVNRERKEQLLTPFVAEIRQGVFAVCPADEIEASFRAHPEMEFAAPPARLPELEDKQFVNRLFEEQGLSVTALNNYLECPWQYFYRNLVRIPEAPNKHLGFGNAIHAALKDYFSSLADGDDRGKDYLIVRFEHALAKQPLPQSDYEEVLERGRTALAGWFTANHDAWNPKTLTERRIEGVCIDDVPVNGMIDKMEFPSDGRAVDVIDYKTGEPKTRNFIEGKTASSNGNYKRQLVFYKLLLDAQGDYDMRSGTIEFIESDEKGKYHRESFAIDDAEISSLKDTVRRVAQEIRSLAFWDRTCDREDCAYCALRNKV